MGTAIIIVASLVVPFTHGETAMAQSDMGHTVSVMNTPVESFMYLATLFWTGLFTIFLCTDGADYLKKKGNYKK